MLFHRDGKLLFTASINSNNAAYIDGQVVPLSDFAGLISTCLLDELLWHRCFCHLNREDIRKLVNGDLVMGMVVKSRETMDPICEPCLAGKQHHVAVPKVAQHCASSPLALVHSDVHGPLPVQSRHHAKYWITFIDDFTCYWVVLPLKAKSEAFAAFKMFKALAENQLNCKIRALCDDKGGEYISGEWDLFCATEGIHRQHTVHAEPHQNGVAERANCTLMEAVISMLNEAKLPGSFWWDAAAAFTHTHNRSPTSALHGFTPFELWHCSKPDVAHFRVFGCTSYMLVKKDKCKQLQSHTQKCVFIGYPTNYKAWLFWNPITKKEVISNSAEFDECYFPGTSTNPVNWPLPPLASEMSQNLVDPVGDISNEAPLDLSIFHGNAPPSASPSPNPSRPNTPPPPPTPVKRERAISDIPSPTQVRPQPKKGREAVYPPSPPPAAKPGRLCAPGWQGDHINTYSEYIHRPTASEFIHRPKVTTSQPEPKVEKIEEMQVDPESSTDELDLLNMDTSEDTLVCEAMAYMAANPDMGSRFLTLEEAFEYAFTTTNHFEHAFKATEHSTHPSEPDQWRDIAGRPDEHLWRTAAMEEFTALLENGTFEPVCLPSGRKAIGCRWVFKLKRKQDGSVDRAKARLVAKGFSQCFGLDFNQVFAPTTKWAALRAIFALAAIEDLELHSLDISNAFLNGELDHEVYMQQPEGFEEYFGAGFVLKLQKALYELKQAGHQWHRKLDSVMQTMDFKLVHCDNSIWVYQKGDVRIIVPVYVDDMTIVSKTTAQYLHVKGKLEKHFKVKELGPTSFLLGVHIERDRSKCLLTLSQHQYIIDTLGHFELGNLSEVTTPLPLGHQLSKSMAPKNNEECAFTKDIPYRQLVGALMYLAVATHPDIAHSVGVLARFSADPGPTHWKALILTLIYISFSTLTLYSILISYYFGITVT